MLKIRALFPARNADECRDQRSVGVKKTCVGLQHRFPSPSKMAGAFLVLVDLRLLLKTQMTWWALGPHPFMPGASSLTWTSTLSLIHQDPARLPHRSLSPLRSRKPVPDGAGTRTLCHSQGPEKCYKFWLLGPRSKYPVGISRRGATVGRGTFSAFTRLQVASRKRKHQVCPAARRFWFWVYLAVMVTDRQGRGEWSFLTQPFVFNHQLSITQGQLVPWFIQLPE